VGSCSKRTNPSPYRPAQAEAVEHQQFALHCRRTHGHQGRPGLVPAELREEDRNHRTKRLLRQLASWDRRIVSVEIEHKPVEGSLVGGKEIPAVAGESRPAGDKESLAVGGKAFLAAKHTVEGSDRPVVEEDKAIPAEVGIVVANSQAEVPRNRVRPGVAETVLAY